MANLQIDKQFVVWFLLLGLIVSTLASFPFLCRPIKIYCVACVSPSTEGGGLEAPLRNWTPPQGPSPFANCDKQTGGQDNNWFLHFNDFANVLGILLATRSSVPGNSSKDVRIFAAVCKQCDEGESDLNIVYFSLVALQPVEVLLEFFTYFPFKHFTMNSVPFSWLPIL